MTCPSPMFNAANSVVVPWRPYRAGAGGVHDDFVEAARDMPIKFDDMSRCVALHLEPTRRLGRVEWKEAKRRALRQPGVKFGRRRAGRG